MNGRPKSVTYVVVLHAESSKSEWSRLESEPSPSEDAPVPTYRKTKACREHSSWAGKCHSAYNICR